MEKGLIKEYIAARVAQELHNGDVVNLGIGLPTMIPKFLPEDVKVILEAENGIVGSIALTNPTDDDVRYSVDAGGKPSGVEIGIYFVLQDWMRLNALLFFSSENIEVSKWSDNWSNYFDDGKE